LSIQKPFSETLEERPSVPTIQELIEDVKRKRIEQDERQAAKGRIPAIDRIKWRQEAEQAKLAKEEESMLVKSLKGAQAAEFWGRKLAEQHARWAMDPNLTGIEGTISYPSNTAFRKRVQEVLSKAYKSGAWPLWDAETFKLQQLATIKALISRAERFSASSETTGAGVKAYASALKLKLAELSSSLTTSHDAKSFKAVNDVLARLVERDGNLIPRLPTFSAVGITARNAPPNSIETLVQQTNQMYISQDSANVL
jgi:hypothetical protein